MKKIQKRLVPAAFALSLATSAMIVPYNVLAKDTADVWPYENLITEGNISSKTTSGFSGIAFNFYSSHPYAGSTSLPKVNVPKYLIYGSQKMPVTNVAFQMNSSNVGELENKGIQYLSFLETEYLTSIGQNAFKNNNIEKIFWNTDRFYQSKHISIGTSAFNRNRLTELDLPSNIISIGDSAFQSNKLVKIVGWENATYIGQYAFDTNKLVSSDDNGYEFEIPKGIERIYSSTFANNELTDIMIPSNVVDIALRAFENNPLRNIYFENPNVTIRANAFSPATSVNVADINFYSYGPVNNVQAYAATLGANYIDLNTLQLFSYANDTDVTTNDYNSALNDAKEYIETNVLDGIVKNHLLQAVSERDNTLKTAAIKNEIRELIDNGKYNEAITKLDDLGPTADSSLNSEMTTLKLEAETKEKETLAAEVISFGANEFDLNDFTDLSKKLDRYSLDKTVLKNTAIQQLITKTNNWLSSNTLINDLLAWEQAIAAADLEDSLKDELNATVEQIIKNNHTILLDNAKSKDSLNDLLVLISYIEDSSTQQMLLNDFASLKNNEKATVDAELLNKVNDLIALQKQLDELKAKQSANNDSKSPNASNPSSNTISNLSNKVIQSKQDVKSYASINNQNNAVEGASSTNKKDAIVVETKGIDNSLDQNEIRSVVSKEQEETMIDTLEKIVSTDPTYLATVLNEQTLNTIYESSEVFTEQEEAYQEQKQLVKDYQVQVNNLLNKYEGAKTEEPKDFSLFNFFGLSISFLILLFALINRSRVADKRKDELADLRTKYEKITLDKPAETK